MRNSIVLFGLFLMVCCTYGYGQGDFPKSWVGNYKGKLEIYGVDSIKMKANMKLEIKETASDSIFDWTLIYEINGKEDIRPYSLVVVDKTKGHYQIDEKNSIIIDGYLHNNNVFTSFFKVTESYVIATYAKKENQLIFEIIAGKGEPISTTGNTDHNGEKIPAVYSYLVNGRQRAILKKME